MTKLQEIYDGRYYYTEPSFNFSLDDDKQRRFGLHVEVLNMLDATGEIEFESAPYIVSVSIVADKPHKSFDESNDGKTSKLALIEDCISYMGGVPVDHVLQDAVNGGFDEIKKQFTLDEAVLIKEKMTFGTIAAQKGKDAEYQYLRFKTEDAANKYVQLLLKRASALTMMIGFILDRPVNMMGETGWSVIEKQVKGCR